MNLRQTADQASSVDLTALLEELRIVIGPSFEEQGISLRFDIDPALPPVWADRQSLLQVFLNLTKNSERALIDQPRREVAIAASTVPHGVQISFRDTGSGVAHPELLFRPFQQQAQATGLGLYLSRAFMRSFRGDLRYEAEPAGSGFGSSFIVELSAVETPKDTYAPHPDPSRGRSQSVPREPEPVARS